MASPEMGIKRQCQSCDAKFYDRVQDPIVCPKCGATFEPVILARSPPRRVGRVFSSPPGAFEDKGPVMAEAEAATVVGDEGDAEDSEVSEEAAALDENEA